METFMINLVNRLRVTQFLLTIIITTLLYSPTWPFSAAAASTTTQLELLKGFKATPDPSTTPFQALLQDSSNNFAFGFLRTNETLLTVAVIHLPSYEPLWVANPTRFAQWSDTTQLSFNGSLVLSDPRSKVFWSTGTQGDRVVLLNSSNLQIIQSLGGESATQSALWQSFDFPTNTLVENQNLTDKMALVSSNGKYSMRLGEDFWGLYAAFRQGSDKNYYKHTAMEVKAQIVKGKGPIYAQINSDGYLGMYQLGTRPPVDILPFTSFQRRVNGLLRLRLEPDGNLKGYYWDGSNWVLNYQAISEPCELPSPCGSYGFCKPGSGCSCLDNRTDFNSGQCFRGVSAGDFCGDDVTEKNFWVLRREGVELPYKELMSYKTTSSLEQCESLCERSCSCWGAVYSNGSGFCYTLDYPIQTLLSVGDQSKMGYFKVRISPRRHRVGVLFRAMIGVLTGIVAVLVGFIGFVVYKKWMKRRGQKRFLEEGTGGASPGPYKDLGSASFRSLEMCSR
ncbi:PAN domain-containing protein At5g03700 [Humulus lupulus]|uniref:PAN domain-containing protein At5g03700 n=1 Tax=Humulus lupulus TaxID=3486 RepID=UPI002B40E03E|nr:PAN domain-containing protein At5g03700 [Humulus lupulus]